MTTIKRIPRINGQPLTDNIVKSLVVQTISVSPQSVKNYVYEKHTYDFDPFNSVVLLNPQNNDIYGYILVKSLNIEHPDVVFSNRNDIIDYINKSNGLHIIDVVLESDIKDTPLIELLNTLQASWCDADFTKDNYYIWMDLGEIIFSPTKEDYGKFNLKGLNKVSRVFYDKCL
ncbi:MAG: hypothetical protein ACI4T9_11305 [Prevotella sp.]|jgi:hypothetical protein